MTEHREEAGCPSNRRPPSPADQQAAQTSRRPRTATIALIGAASLFGASCVLVSNYALTQFSRPGFCVSCHEMDAQHAGWLQSPHYINRSGVAVTCVECHLPARDGLVARLTANCWVGVEHAAVHFFGKYDPEASRRAVQQTLPNERCVNCHSRLAGSPSSPAVAIVHETAMRRSANRAHACVTCHHAIHGPRAALAATKTYQRGDNSYCLVCHVNFQREEFTSAHLKAGVVCSKCHGSSHPHAADEEHLTAPDILISKARLNASCMTADCHPRAGMEAEIGHGPFFAGADPDHPYCTDCHGKHRLPSRTKRWDKDSRQLIEVGG